MPSPLDSGTHFAPPRPVTTTSRLRLTTDPSASTLWTAADVARYLRSSLSFVYKVAETGMLPCLRVGALLRFDPEAVRAFARGETKSR
ncbi:MAG TPA: helix-turn-helix domain-containing protein [Anaeromyxobacteraceae bacterium]|nr:helix-turn-helix domain-containing protein [Anaeromyxobacteraceae bacterium]